MSKDLVVISPDTTDSLMGFVDYLAQGIPPSETEMHIAIADMREQIQIMLEQAHDAFERLKAGLLKTKEQRDTLYDELGQVEKLYISGIKGMLTLHQVVVADVLAVTVPNNPEVAELVRQVNAAVAAQILEMMDNAKVTADE